MERVGATGRHGWYLRVLEEGEVSPGEPLTRLERPCPEWTIARAFHVMSHRSRMAEDAASLARVPALAQSWREQLA
jgi:MOSC domain-containing protein YiiM